MNCAECEPLLKLHRQLLEKHAYEIMKTFNLVAETVGASEAIIGIKKSYVQTVKALQQHMRNSRESGYIFLRKFILWEMKLF